MREFYIVLFLSVSFIIFCDGFYKLILQKNSNTIYYYLTPTANFGSHLNGVGINSTVGVRHIINLYNTMSKPKEKYKIRLFRYLKVLYVL